MAYHTILVHLDTGPTCAARTELAAGLAREHGGHLTGLAPTGRAQIPIDIASTLLEPGFLVASNHHLRVRAGLACEEFSALAAAAKVGSFEALVDEDDHAASVIARACGADLLVVGQTERDAPVGVVNRDLPEQVALGSGRPVLVVPFAGRFEAIGQRVLVAWNHSREAARAVADALPLLKRAQRVTVLTQRAADAPAPGMHGLEAWLARHGVKAVFAHEVSELDVGNRLLSRASDLDIDLIVMGCYGHSRLTERILGGATRTMLEQMTVPVLFAH
jgi:nucleotide-binding universal stress UspA family protein